MFRLPQSSASKRLPLGRRVPENHILLHNHGLHLVTILVAVSAKPQADAIAHNQTNASALAAARITTNTAPIVHLVRLVPVTSKSHSGCFASGNHKLEPVVTIDLDDAGRVVRAGLDGEFRVHFGCIAAVPEHQIGRVQDVGRSVVLYLHPADESLVLVANNVGRSLPG
jgi:hypothetical protein